MVELEDEGEEEGRAWRSRGHQTPCDLVIQLGPVCVLMAQDVHPGWAIKE